MKILALSDIHERVRRIDSLREKLSELEFKPDLILVAGDITYFKGIDIATKILKKLRNDIEAPVFFVPGNCDTRQLLEVDEIADDIDNIHLRVIELHGYLFYGIGGGGISPFHTLIEFSEDEFREFIAKVENTVDTRKLILVTHQPVKGFFDEVDGLNIGSEVFAEYLLKLKPLLWITGHVHENSGWTRIERTVIMHPGPLMYGYYGLIELEDETIKFTRVMNLD